MTRTLLRLLAFSLFLGTTACAHLGQVPIAGSDTSWIDRFDRSTRR